MGTKIYISPSVQQDNVGVGAYGTEEYRMNQIADVVMRELAKYKNIELKRNNPNMDWQGITKDSNNWKADYHIAIHSNASNGQARGVEVFHYVDGKENNSLKISRSILNNYMKIYNGPNRGLKNGMHLFEVNDNIIAASSLIEVGFHDNWTDATFIIENIEKIGQAIVDGILEHLSVDRQKDVGLKDEYVQKPSQVVEKIVYVDRPVEVIKEVIKEVEKEVKVEVPVEKIVYQDKMREPTIQECFKIILEYILKIFKKK